MRRLIVSLYVFAFMLALPVAAFAAQGSAEQNQGKPTGHDWTITTIFFIALSIPALLGLLTLIDIARGKHTQRHN